MSVYTTDELSRRAKEQLAAAITDIHCELTLGESEGHGAGRAAMASTAMRVVNAIPYVVDASPGLLSSLDIPTTLPLYAFD